MAIVQQTRLQPADITGMLEVDIVKPGRPQLVHIISMPEVSIVHTARPHPPDISSTSGVTTVQTDSPQPRDSSSIPVITLAAESETQTADFISMPGIKTPVSQIPSESVVSQIPSNIRAQDSARQWQVKRETNCSHYQSVPKSRSRRSQAPERELTNSTVRREQRRSQDTSRSSRRE